MSDQPPVVDLGPLSDGSMAGLERVAAELEAPCAERGVFHVIGHGIPDSELAAFEGAMRALFAAPREVKRSVLRTRDNARGYYDEELAKNRPDWKEVFDYGAEVSEADAEGGAAHSDGWNQWPAELPELRPILLRHHARCETLGLTLLRAICVSLGWTPDRLVPYFGDRASFVRLNRYPRCPTPAAPDADFFPEEGNLGVHHHSDAGALTLLCQDERLYRRDLA